MKRIFSIVLVIAALTSLTPRTSSAHCEIPCGIYEDTLRIELIAEHITTIEKSMNQINDLAQADEVNYNQLVRWVVNKEEHAVKIQDIVSQYFLHQRIIVTSTTDKAAYEKYTKQLSLLHQLLVLSMKAKQTTDLGYIEELRSVLHEFSHSYFHGHNH